MGQRKKAKIKKKWKIKKKGQYRIRGKRMRKNKGEDDIERQKINNDAY